MPTAQGPQTQQGPGAQMLQPQTPRRLGPQQGANPYMAGIGFNPRQQTQPQAVQTPPGSPAVSAQKDPQSITAGILAARDSVGPIGNPANAQKFLAAVKKIAPELTSEDIAALPPDVQAAITTAANALKQRRTLAPK